MLLSDFSIRQPVTTVAMIIVLMCLGLLALKNLRVNQIPDVEQPVMVINFPYPGASPETVEREIVNRVEKALLSIPQVYEIRSTSDESSFRRSCRTDSPSMRLATFSMACTRRGGGS